MQRVDRSQFYGAGCGVGMVRGIEASLDAGGFGGDPFAAVDGGIVDRASPGLLRGFRLGLRPDRKPFLFGVLRVIGVNYFSRPTTIIFNGPPDG
jgi:hypothetical protein